MNESKEFVLLWPTKLNFIFSNVFICFPSDLRLDLCVRKSFGFINKRERTKIYISVF